MSSDEDKTTERLILEGDFDGDLEAYAEASARSATAEIKADPTHPWHHRKRVAKALVDMPEDHVAPPHLRPLWTRAEIIEMFKMSDSALGKLGVPPVRKSGRWSLYDAGTVLDYLEAAQYTAGFRKSAGRPPDETRHQIAARIRAERMTDAGPPPPIYNPEETQC